MANIVFFYSKCLDDALPRTMNNGLVYECSMKSKEKIDNLIEEKISSKRDCDNEGFESHACSLKRSQEALKPIIKLNVLGISMEICMVTAK